MSPFHRVPCFLSPSPKRITLCSVAFVTTALIWDKFASARLQYFIDRDIKTEVHGSGERLIKSYEGHLKALEDHFTGKLEGDSNSVCKGSAESGEN